MVNIDTVYQKVLAFANKEQRGYITPQEFNLYANQAQQEIFEQYFYDKRHQGRIKSTEHAYPDMDDLLDEKLAFLEKTDYNADILAYSPILSNPLDYELPSYIYRVLSLYVLNMLNQRVQVEFLNTEEYHQCVTGPALTAPSSDRIVGNIRGNAIQVLEEGYRSGIGLVTPLPFQAQELIYYKKPGGINSAGTYANVAWGYFVVGGKALYDTSTNKTFHFELHPAEENELVYKILKYAGLSMKRDDIAKGGQGLESLQTQQEKL